MNTTESPLSGSLSSKYANENTIHGIYIAEENVKSLGVYHIHDKNKCYESKWTNKWKN
jgi:hypothetical protein